MEAAARDSRARVVLWSTTLANAMILVDQTAVPLALPNGTPARSGPPGWARQQETGHD
jgi:hypothetical protein